MGETRVDLQHLLEDLRDAYTGSLEETILTEVVANALDSGATHIRLLTDPADATLTIVDDGRGMQRRELARYHDVAASSKARGEGIGFAGVGIKLGLLVSREVVTETRRGATHVATRWHLASRHRAPWKWIPPRGLASSRGTAVRLIVANQLSPLLDAGYLEETIQRHFEPLLDPRFDDLLRRHYPDGIRFQVDGRDLARAEPPGSERVPISIRLGRRRTPSAIGYLERNALLHADRDGIAISTFGKVIKRGWDWLGLAPAAAARVSGLIEVPDLAACLTLSKNDFIRTGTRGGSYLAYRKAIQEVVSRQLAEWGDAHDPEARPRTARLERDLERVLEDLADNFPLLRSLVDRRAGGQKRLPCRAKATSVLRPRCSQRHPWVKNPRAREALRRLWTAAPRNRQTGRYRRSLSRRRDRLRRCRLQEIQHPPRATRSWAGRRRKPISSQRPGRSRPCAAAAARRGTVYWFSSSRGLPISSWAASWTARSGSTTHIQPTRGRWPRGRSVITRRSRSPSRWRRWRSKRATSTRSSRNSLRTGAAHRRCNPRPPGAGAEGRRPDEDAVAPVFEDLK